MAESVACSPLKAPFCPGSLCFPLESFMFLVSQGPFSLSPFPSVPGRRLCWSMAIPYGSSRLDAAQCCKPCGGSCFAAPGPVPWQGLSSSCHSHPGVHPQTAPSTLTYTNEGCFAASEHLPGDTWHSAAAPGVAVLPVPKVSQRLFQIYRAVLHPRTPREGSIFLFFLFISLVSALLPLPEAASGLGNRHRAAARCQQRLKG